MHDEVRECPRADHDPRPHDLRGAELLLDHEQLERRRVAPPRLRPRRRDVALVDEAIAPRLRVERRDLGKKRPQIGAEPVGIGADVDRQPPANTCEREPRGALAPLARRRDELVQRDRAAKVEVGVVLPREPDPAVRLHAVLRVLERGIERERRRTRDREPGAVVGLGLAGSTVDGARGVPHRGSGELGSREHLGTAMLHGLELTDRPSELHSFLGVLARRVDAPLRDSDRLRREQHRGEIVHPLAVDALQRVVERDDCAVDVDPAGAPSQVDALLRDDRDRCVIELERAPHGHTVAPIDRHQRDVGERGAEHRCKRSRQPQAASYLVSLERAGQRNSDDARTARDLREQRLGRTTVGRLGEHHAGEHGGQERPGYAATTELLEHDRELDRSVARAAERLGYVQSGPTERAQPRPEGR